MPLETSLTQFQDPLKKSAFKKGDLNEVWVGKEAVATFAEHTSSKNETTLSPWGFRRIFSIFRRGFQNGDKNPGACIFIF